MKNASIFHGHGSTSQSYWHPWLKNKLKKSGYTVWLPDLPGTNAPTIEKWLPFALYNGKYNSDTVLIGHSCGVPLVLSILENIDTKIEKAILIAGFSTPLDEKPDPILQKNYDWEKIKKHCREFILINSDNDPWGCDDKQGKVLADNLGGKLIVRHDGHMGSTTYNQPYEKFPLLLELIKIEV